MAYNTGFEANTEQLQQVQQVISVAESPFIGGSGTNVQSKRQRNDSPILLNFGPPDLSSNVTEGLSVCLETKKLIVSTCRTTVLFESNFAKLEVKSRMLQEHSSNGTIPKDLLLPKKEIIL